MEYIHLEEVRTKFWQELATTEGNLANILIAMEVAYELNLNVTGNALEATAAWGEVMDTAKGIIRNIYKELVGFNVHEILEYTRIIYLHRTFTGRMTSSGLYASVIHGSNEASDGEEGIEHQLLANGRAAAERAINIKMSSIRHYTGPHNTIEFDRILRNCIDELDRILTEREYGTTARDRSTVMEVAVRIIHEYMYLFAVMNTFNFKAFDIKLVSTYLTDMFVALNVPLENRDTLMRACIELVE